MAIMWQAGGVVVMAYSSSNIMEASSIIGRHESPEIEIGLFQCKSWTVLRIYQTSSSKPSI